MELLVEANCDREALTACHYRFQDIKLTSDPHSAEDIKALLMEQHQILYVQLKEKEILIYREHLTQMAVLHVHTSPGSSQFQA